MNIPLLILIFCNIAFSTHKIDPKAEENFFDQIDSDNDGIIEAEELREFIRDEVGGESFDTISELDHGTQDAFQEMDSQKDNHLEVDDMIHHWKKLGKMLTTTDVADWITYGLELPQISPVFQQNGISGLDFPTLCQADGKELVEIGVTNKIHRQRITRGMKMILLQIGDEPQIPVFDVSSKSGCNWIELSWNLFQPEYSLPVTRFRLQRRVVSSDLKAPGSWATIWNGTDHSHTDLCLQSKTTYEYRVQAWNAVGHSSFSETKQFNSGHHCPADPHCHVNPPSEHHANGLSYYITLFIALAVALYSLSQKHRSPSIAHTTAHGHPHTPTPNVQIAPIRPVIPITPISPVTSPRPFATKPPLPRAQSAPCSHTLRLHKCRTCKHDFCGNCGRTKHIVFRPCSIDNDCVCHNCMRISS